MTSFRWTSDEKTKILISIPYSDPTDDFQLSSNFPPLSWIIEFQPKKSLKANTKQKKTWTKEQKVINF